VLLPAGQLAHWARLKLSSQVGSTLRQPPERGSLLLPPILLQDSYGSGTGLWLKHYSKSAARATASVLLGLHCMKQCPSLLATALCCPARPCRAGLANVAVLPQSHQTRQTTHLAGA
jgi:hypothetical protein